MRSAVLISFLVASCVVTPADASDDGMVPKGERDIPVFISPTFVREDAAVVMEAMGRWNYALNGQVSLRQVDERGGVEIDVANSVTCGCVPQGIRKDVIAWTTQVGGRKIVVLRDRVKDEQLLSIVMHEIGHMLGAPDHPDSDDCLMRSTYNGWTCVDARSAVDVASYRGLSITGMRTCTR